MSIINANPLLAAAGGGYQISRSVRLRSSASAYFNRTLGTATNSLAWTYSAWVKRGTLGVNQYIFYARDSAGTNNRLLVSFDSANTLYVYLYRASDGAYPIYLGTAAVFRDPSAWYHVQIAYDSANATTVNRVRIYVNGVLQTISGTVTTTPTATPSGLAIYPTSSLSGVVNTAVPHDIGRESVTPSGYFDGYLTEVNFIDGQALTPSSFGETDAVTGVWKPKKYAGTYGTNGFYLNFSDNSNNTAATIGKDNSGNGNNWTPNNISVTAGVTYDSMIDTPTPYADGGNGRGNYAVLNPVFKNANATYGVMATPSDGNLNATMGSGTNVYSTMALPTSGKIYVECEAVSWTSQLSIGFMSDDGNANRSAWWNNANGIYVDNAQQFAGATSTGIIGIAVDCDAKTVQFYRDNSARGSAYTYGTGSVSAHLFWAYTNSGATVRWNFGQRPFTYTPPTGFKALNTQNLPDSTIKKGNQFFDATTYTGNGSALTVTNNGSMQPDLLWTKQRSSTAWHYLQDAVRGVNKGLFSNATDAEYSITPTTTTLNSNGFSFNGAESGLNANGATYVAWQWKESASAGFDIVTWTGTGVNRTIAHSLGVAPKMIIAKHKDAVDNWIVYHASLGGSPDYLWLNLTSAKGVSSTVWNTAPTSSVFGVGTDNLTNLNGGSYVAYLFAEVAGFSKFGSYTGNGSADGPFVYCGFRPKYVLTKSATGVESWYINDSSMNPYNVTTSILAANTSAAEATGSWIDILSNGFKIRYNASPFNTSGGTYIFMAFAENPFKNSLAR